MFKHYLAVAWLNVRRNPFTTAVSVLTLALGLVSFIVAAAVAVFWSRADQQFANASRTFVMTSEWRLLDGSQTSSGVALPLTNHHLAAYLKSDFPLLEAVARVIKLSDSAPVRAGDRTLRLRAFAADREFLNIFNLPFRSGTPHSALTAPRSVVVTAATAQRLYGDARALGKSIVLYGDIDATITGVVDRIPEPSHMGRSAGAPLQFDILASRDIYESLERIFSGGRDTTHLPTDWFDASNITYVLLPRDGLLTADMLRNQLPVFVDRHLPAEQRTVAHFQLDLVPVSDLLGMAVRDTLFPRESAASIPMLMLLLGAIVLMVACVNFANLATAKAAGRARETGVRIAIGARPHQVITQFLLEAGVLTSAALIVALIITSLLIRPIDTIAGIDLRALWSANLAGWIVVSLAALALCVTVAAGFYPALVLSRVRPAVAVRSGPTQSVSRSLMAMLVGVQFAFAAFLLIGIGVVDGQNERLKRFGHGLAGDPLLVVENYPQITGLNQETLRRELLRLPYVKSATAIETRPWAAISTRMPLSSSPNASRAERTAFVNVVGYDFFRTFDIELLAGRVFDPARPDDAEVATANPQRIQKVVIARKLAEELGFHSPAHAIDRVIYIPTSITGEAAARPFQVIGVVEDKSLAIASRFGARPNVYLFNPVTRFPIVRVDDKNIGLALQSIDALWKRLVPNIAPNRRFVADYFDDSFANFARIGDAFAMLALIAWVISTIGLYAMAHLVAGRRTREIAIRKTLGAHAGEIVLMLLRNFAKPVLIANAIAWPFALIAAHTYLNIFIDPMPLTAWPFIIALITSLLIAWLAVGGHAWRAARLKPADVLRHE